MYEQVSYLEQNILTLNIWYLNLLILGSFVHEIVIQKLHTSQQE